MHTEIERKFLVTNSLFMEQAVRIMNIRQGYIGTPGRGKLEYLYEMKKPGL